MKYYGDRGNDIEREAKIMTISAQREYAFLNIIWGCPSNEEFYQHSENDPVNLSKMMRMELWSVITYSYAIFK